jgi:hypothetical protein
MTGHGTSCPGCGKTFECLFAPLPAYAKKTSVAGVGQRPSRLGVCVNHPENEARFRCRQCRAAICDVCAFPTHMGKYCPKCMSKGTSPESLAKSRRLAVTSIVMAGVSFFIMFIAFVVVATAGPGEEEAMMALSGLCFWGAVIAAIIGLATGFTSRDKARKTSGLALAGIITNGVLIGLFVLLFLVGMLMGG